jgi:hypothetical protein
MINTVFGGPVPVIPGSVGRHSVDQGDWFDLRTGPVVQGHSGFRFGVQFGFGDFSLDFTPVGGASGFSGWACAAGVGDDLVEFFDMCGEPMAGTFTKVGGFGGFGIMEEFSFISPVPIGRIRLTGRETCFDDICDKSAGAPSCPACLADCDDSGSLDFFDFLCFQNLFAAQDPCADCDGSGGLDLLTLGIPCNHRIVGTWIPGWHGYVDSVYYTNGIHQLEMGIPGNAAFRFYMEPNPFAEIEFEITGRGAGGQASVVAAISGAEGAARFAICGGVETIITRATDGVSDFVVGWFAIDDRTRPDRPGLPAPQGAST